MATIALPRPLPAHRAASPIPIEQYHNSSVYQLAIPNKHLPTCPTGPAPAIKPDTPPASPPTKNAELEPSSLLYPTTKHQLHSSASEDLQIYSIDAAGVASAIHHLASQPLPDPTQLFPWLHGLHEKNQLQQAFFIARRTALRKTPTCMRGIVIVKAGGSLGASRLKGAVLPEELLQYSDYDEQPPRFQDVDPAEGFSVRNFQIQAAKLAMLSDIIVYGDDQEEVDAVARDIAYAQQIRRREHEMKNQEISIYNTFVCTSPFSDFEEKQWDIVAIDSRGEMTGEVMDFFHRERVEMCNMTAASEIAHNIWLGPTPDPSIDPTLVDTKSPAYDILIECSDLGRMVPQTLKSIHDGSFVNEVDGEMHPAYLEFPSSGSVMPPSWSQTEADGILETCKWMHLLANGLPASASSPADSSQDTEGDSPMPDSQIEETVKRSEKKFLIHCADGYTESSMLGMAYFIYATGLPVHSAWVKLHTEKKRNFFAYPSDVALLNSIAPRLLTNSPALPNSSLQEITALIRDEPRWLRNMDGSLPSRILPYMYLGNLGHANNPDMLKELNIGQILSVGETYTWPKGQEEKWGLENICVVKGVQDNGVDPLTAEFDRCLEFIDRGRRNGTATLVHCRVGVSRSATICIAEVMRSMQMSYPRAYCFVRARRLNVIIQPHLRFSYELLKWEEEMCRRRNQPIKREMEWWEIAREIAAMNRPYSR